MSSRLLQIIFITCFMACNVFAALTMPAPLRGFNTTVGDRVSYSIYPCNVFIEGGEKLTSANTQSIKFNLDDASWLQFDAAAGTLSGVTPQSAVSTADKYVNIPVIIEAKNNAGSISSVIQMHLWPSSLSPALDNYNLKAKINESMSFNFSNATLPGSNAQLTLLTFPSETSSWLKINLTTKTVYGKPPIGLQYNSFSILLNSWVPETDLTNIKTLTVPIENTGFASIFPSSTDGTIGTTSSSERNSSTGISYTPAVTVISNGDLTPAQKAGLAVGIVLAVLIFLGLILLFIKRRTRKAYSNRHSNAYLFSPSDNGRASTLNNNSSNGRGDVERSSGLSDTDDPFTCNSPTLGSHTPPQKYSSDEQLEKIPEVKTTQLFSGHDSIVALFRVTDSSPPISEELPFSEKDVSIPQQLAAFRNPIMSSEMPPSQMRNDISMNFTDDGTINDYGDATLGDDSISEGHFSIATSMGSRASWESISSSVRKASSRAFAKRFTRSNSGNIAKPRADFRPTASRHQSFPSATRIPEEEGEGDVTSNEMSQPASLSGAVVTHGELIHNSSIPRFVPVQPRFSQEYSTDDLPVIRMHSDNIPISVRDIAD